MCSFIRLLIDAWQHLFTSNLMLKLAGSFFTEENCHRAWIINMCLVWVCWSKKYWSINTQAKDVRNLVYFLSMLLLAFLLSGCLGSRAFICSDVASDFNLLYDGLMLGDHYVHTFPPCDSTWEKRMYFCLISLPPAVFPYISPFIFIHKSYINIFKCNSNIVV